jgi:GxxExxY protein
MNADGKSDKPSVLIDGELTEKILGASFKVLNTLGAGFLEKVYVNALSIELRRMSLPFEIQKAFHISYEGTVVGDYVADLVVAGKVIVECKAAINLDSVHDAQLINYLKASGLHVGLLINFGKPKLQYRRRVV